MSSSLTKAVMLWCSGSSTMKLRTWLKVGSLLFQMVLVRCERPSRTDMSTKGSTCAHDSDVSRVGVSRVAQDFTPVSDDDLARQMSQ